MGTRSQKYFDDAAKLGGLVAKMRLASFAQVTSTEASTQTDTPELLARLDSAFERIRQEFGQAVPNDNGGSPLAAAPRDLVGASGNPELARRCMTVIAELIAQRSLFIGDLLSTVRRVTEASASVLSIERVSVWLLDKQHTQLTCADLFERSAARHSSGTVLKAADHAVYFTALAGARTIAAEDANTDPRTSCFAEVYFKPLNIGALLDVPIWAANEMVGVICHEHVGSTRHWSTEDETLGYILASLVALTLEQRGRNRAGAAA